MVASDRFPRVALLLISLLFLILGLLAGLARLNLHWPLAPPPLAVIHGPLMICGFLGTLISLERAVALGRWWGYAAPLITAVGTLSLVAGIPTKLAMILIVLGSLALVWIFVVVLLRHPALYTVTMSLGAVAWLVGNALWFGGVSIPQMVHWWIGFLILTIAGERLELSRLAAPFRHAISAFRIGLILFVAGLICASFLPLLGHRLAGLGMVTLVLWLARFDVARFTVHRVGLPRFIAFCLFAGYAWLGVGGSIWIFAVPTDVTGSFSFFTYDAMLHAILLGFVFSMIFAHAPIIFPSVAGRPLAFRSVFYVHVLLLHLSLAARIAGDLGGSFPLVRWAGLGNVAALAVFLGTNVFTMIVGQCEAKIAMRASVKTPGP